MQSIAKQIHSHIQNARKIIIVPHKNPDGDSLGAAAALAEYLRLLKKPALIFCSPSLPAGWNFLPHLGQARSGTDIFADEEIDTILVVDSGDLRHTGAEYQIKNHTARLINIDHHHTNEKFGHYNLVLPRAASTTEILYYFFRHNNIRINRAIATALLTGLITDTENFTNQATTSAALAVAGQLVRNGGNLNIVNNRTVKNKTIKTLRLWGAAFRRLVKDDDVGLTYTYITRQDLAENNLSEEDAEGVANFLNKIDDTRVGLILKETKDGKIKGSFRTVRDDVDVAEWAKKFGGGGHKKAAGFTAEGTIEEVLKKILALQ